MFKYEDQDGEHVITEEEIMRDFFPDWAKGMKERGKGDLVSKENCIQDYCVVHWAHEIDVPNKE